MAGAVGRVLVLVSLVSAVVQGQERRADVWAAVQAQRAPLLDTLRELVSIESGSADHEGLTRIGALVADRLRALGGEVQIVPTPADTVRFGDTPPRIGDAVVARFRGTGTSRILLLAHMDTVYPRGTLEKQPFRVEGNRAYGAGIADDKHGVALILHALALLRALDVRSYGLITVLINADEEVSSPGSRRLITRLGAEHDLVLSCEGGPADAVRLATAGIAAVRLTVTGRASHAGSAPEQGRNALYELAHQILRTRELSDARTGVKMNWTLASAGTARNVIPAEARATADVRVLRLEDYDGIERRVRERIGTRLIPDTQTEIVFERRRPPMELRESSRRAAAHAQRIYRELGRTLAVEEVPTGGGTDAAFAALDTDAPVIEGMGLQTFGAHSDAAEYLHIDSIEPRLYLLARMIIDVGGMGDKR
jgi:glutamate carboxypeptidase